MEPASSHRTRAAWKRGRIVIPQGMDTDLGVAEYDTVVVGKTEAGMALKKM